MISDGHILLSLAAMGYLLAFAVWLPALRGAVSNGEPAHSPIFAYALLFLAFLAHTAGMIFTGIRAGRCPVGNPLEVLQFVAWSVVVTYGMVSFLFRSSLPAFFTAAMAGVLCVLALQMGQGDFNASAPPVVMAHAGLSLFAYGAFGLIALTSLMYLIQLSGIRHRRWANIFALLPSLRELERVNLRLLVVGLIVYFSAIALGAWWYLSGQGNVSVMKLAFASLVLVGYGAALVLRLCGVLYGRRLAIAGLFLFGLALVTLYPVEHRSAATSAVQAVEVVP